MIKKGRWFILLGFVAVLISGSIWNIQFRTPTSENAYKSTKPQKLGLNEAYMTEKLCYVIVYKCPDPPEEFVDLSEEEVAMFPKLQAALQTFEGSNQTEVRYKAYEWEANKIFHYLENKTSEKYNCEFCLVNNFKYRGECYHFVIMIDVEEETTSVAEGFSNLGMVFFLCAAGFIVFYARCKMKRKSY